MDLSNPLLTLIDGQTFYPAFKYSILKIDILLKDTDMLLALSAPVRQFSEAFPPRNAPHHFLANIHKLAPIMINATCGHY